MQAKVKDLLEVFNTGSDMALSFFVPSKLPVLRDRHCGIPVGTAMHQQPHKNHRPLSSTRNFVDSYVFLGFPIECRHWKQLHILAQLASPTDAKWEGTSVRIIFILASWQLDFEWFTRHFLSHPKPNQHSDASPWHLDSC